MKRVFPAVFLVATWLSCAPVIQEEFMRTGSISVPFPDMSENPGLYKGKLFILGGLIADTRAIKKGSLIEALYIPVDSRGYLQTTDRPMGRFLAYYPKERGLLDPLIYKKGKAITIAAEFAGTQKGKLDEMDYTYPLLEIKEIYLWPERSESYYWPYPAYYPYWYYPYSYHWRGPWWGPYPLNPYW
jgi:outer membrane lipoprotein